MRKVQRVVLAVMGAALLAAPLGFAIEFEGSADGLWINVDTVEIKSLSEGDYYEFLGKGYVVLLQAVKAEGLIVDFGVMQKMTGSQGEGDMVIWWSVKSLADFEKVWERFEELSGELFVGPEWADMWAQMEKVRTIQSTNLYREVTWTEASDEE